MTFRWTLQLLRKIIFSIYVFFGKTKINVRSLMNEKNISHGSSVCCLNEVENYDDDDDDDDDAS